MSSRYAPVVVDRPLTERQILEIDLRTASEILATARTAAAHAATIIAREEAILKSIRERLSVMDHEWQGLGGPVCASCGAPISKAQAGLSRARAANAPAECKDCCTAILTRARLAGGE